MGRTYPCVDNTEAALTIARAEIYRTTANRISLTKAAAVLAASTDEADRATARDICAALAAAPAGPFATSRQSLAISLSAGDQSARMAQHFEAMNTRSRPGLIRRALGAMGISCCLISAIHITSDLGARVAADVSRAKIEYCGKC